MTLFYYEEKEGWVAVKIVKNETPFSVDEIEEHILNGDYEWFEKNGLTIVEKEVSL